MIFSAEQLDTLAGSGVAIFRPTKLNDDIRTNLQGEPFLAVDGKSPHEIDDAMRVQRLRGGGFLTQVAIAEAAQIDPESDVFSQALELKYNTYDSRSGRPKHCIYPKSVTGELELSPGEGRRAMVTEQAFDRDGQPVGEPVIFPALIDTTKLTVIEMASRYVRHNGHDAPVISFYQARSRSLGHGHKTPDADAPSARLTSFGYDVVRVYMEMTNRNISDWAAANAVEIPHISLDTAEQRQGSKPDYILPTTGELAAGKFRTHGTSPLRRVIDSVVQLQAAYHIAGRELPFDHEQLAGIVASNNLK